MKKHLLHFLLAFLLLCAQAFAAVHAVDHAVEGQGLPTHVCELCLAVHDLGAGLNSSIAVPVTIAASYLPHDYFCTDRGALPAPQARQQSPPTA
jgi:hypothetical protein